MSAELAERARPATVSPLATLPRRITFPMHLLDEATPRCAPDAANRDRTLSLTDRKAPFLLLYQSLVRLGCRPDRYAPGEADLGIYWTAKQIPEVDRGRAIVMEVAWLPRWHYQVSPDGSNALGHYAETFRPTPLRPAQDAQVRSHMARMRTLFTASVNPANVERLRRTLPPAFVLFALQLANDFNLKHSGSDFARFHSADDAQTIALAQACVDSTRSLRHTLPIVFRQHPADPNPGMHGHLEGADFVIDKSDDVSCHDIFATGRCQAVVSINSNTTHEAAAWGIPSICLGRLIWQDASLAPFAGRLEDLGSVVGTSPLDDPRVLAYLHHLLRHQWTLSDFQQPQIVETLLRSQGRCEPAVVRQTLGLG